MTQGHLSPDQLRTLHSIGAVLTSHRCVLIGAVAIQYRVSMPRFTADLDVAVVASGAAVSQSLSAAGWTPDSKARQRWRRQGLTIDVIPISDEELLAGVVHLDGAELSVVGFDLALSEGDIIRVSSTTEVLVPPLPVLALLKMISWMDRPYEREKDLGDIVHICDNALGDEDRWAEQSPWLDAGLTYDDQSAFFVGWKLGQIAGPGHVHWAKRFLDRVRDADSTAFAQLVRASRYAGDNVEAMLRGRLSAFEFGLEQGSIRPAPSDQPKTLRPSALFGRASLGTPLFRGQTWGVSGSLEQRLHDAIDNKRVIQFYYGGHLRIVQPHVLGVKNGRLHVLTYQVGGRSSSGALPDWRRFFVNELSKLDFTAQTFVPQPMTYGRHSAFDRQIAVVRSR